MSAPCASCGGAIIWAVTVNGKSMPIDETPNLLLGNITLRPADDPREPPLAVVAKKKGESGSYTSHFATCPHASLHRKKKP